MKKRLTLSTKAKKCKQKGSMSTGRKEEVEMEKEGGRGFLSRREKVGNRPK